MKIPQTKNISLRIEPNYSTWQTIELTYESAKYAIDNNIPGVFVECGIACGNNLAAMCLAGRHGYGFDSFEGIPWAGPNDTQQPGIGKKDKSKEGLLESSGVTVHAIDDVEKNFVRWGLDNYNLIKGWFIHTTLGWNEPIAVLRLDGDLYSSTFECLENMYPYLSKGGILIIDDYQLDGCRKAFDDYFSIVEKPELIFDYGVTYWKK